MQARMHIPPGYQRSLALSSNKIMASIVQFTPTETHYSAPTCPLANSIIRSAIWADQPISSHLQRHITVHLHVHWPTVSSNPQFQQSSQLFLTYREKLQCIDKPLRPRNTPDYRRSDGYWHRCVNYRCDSRASCHIWQVLLRMPESHTSTPGKRWWGKGDKRKGEWRSDRQEADEKMGQGAQVSR